MHLWNDYEGTTLAGQWKLGHLLRTEGRSALFATTQADGSPAVLRLTEALNDQAVLQARYRAIQAAGDTYLVAVTSFGDAVMDGAPLSYAVLEPTQESLADIVAHRRLAPEEVYEVAIAVAGGLLALHGQGLVHGLVEPESVLAAGDRIKLRSDCARPAPSAEDATLEGAITAQTDARGLAEVIYRSLTQGRLYDAADALALPEPFATIVRNTARGAWGVPQIDAELQRYRRAHAPAPAAPASVAPREQPVRDTPVAPPASPSVPVANASSVPVANAPSAPILFESTAPLSSRAKLGTLDTNEDSTWLKPEPVSGGKLRLILIAAGVVLLLIALLVFHHRANNGDGATSAVTPAASTKEVPAAHPLAPAALPASVAKPSPTTSLAKPDSTLAPGEKVWRVIAYTYNQQNAAERKAASLNGQFPSFNAQAWSRTGQGPFLVTLGGEMTRSEAIDMRMKALHVGVAPDVYARNYAR